MPVSVSRGSLGEPRAKRCKHCDESSHRNESGSGYWQLQLDRDLVDTISAIYPEWFKTNMAEGGTPPRESPPKAVVDTSPILNSLEQNRESLKVKLMLRRPLEQLVDQGIMPPLKTPAAFHGQRRQLERAKTGDLLKSKIQQRPSRTELESRHILEPDPHVDPSLADKQRKLKKARLADQLNVQLSHRPGPLELIRKNILHTEEPIEHAVKAGHIPYRATCEGQLNRPQQPLSYVNPEDDSQSSEDNSTSPGPADVLETAAKAAGIVVSLIPTGTDTVVVATTSGQLTAVPTTTLAPLKTDNSDLVFADLCRSVAAPLLTQASASSPASLVSSTSTLSPLSSIASPGPSILSQPATPGPPLQLATQRPLASATPSIVAQQPQTRTDAPGKDKNRKKSKSKAIPKARTIKFHEYKGPPSAQKTTSSCVAGAQGESSYQLLLEQQQLLLQYQLQLNSKNNKPCLILPAQAAPDPATNGHAASQVATTGGSNKSAPTVHRFLGRLEDMKVTDLKAELKRRNLPVSGSKPQLIERLKPFTGASSAQSAATVANVSTASCDSFQDTEASHNSPIYSVDAASPQTVVSEDHTEHMDVGECEPPSPAMSLSQQAVETPESLEVINLQQRRIEELERQLQLHKQKLEAATKTQYVQILERIQSIAARQNAEEDQKMLQQQQQAHVAFQNQKNQQSNDAPPTLLLAPEKLKLFNGHNRSNSLPNFIQTLTSGQTPPTILKDVKPPPPMYDESMVPKMLKKKDVVKSQDVDDVLDILIKSGELPPSAAQDPLTPSSANAIKAEQPAFPCMAFINTTTSVASPQHQPQQFLPQQHIFQQLLQQHQPPLQQQESAENILGLGLDANDILHHLDIDDFMELCGQHITVNNNATAADNANAEVSMETDDWLDLLQSAPSVDNAFATVNGTTPSATTSLTMANNNLPDITPSQELGYDPVIAIGQNPHDPFNLDEFRSPPDWDRLDFAV